MKLHEVSATASGAGAIWALGGSDELNANLVRFPAGGGVGEHVNDEVDVIVVGVAGSGVVAVNGEQRTLETGTLMLVPRGSRRSTRSTSESFAYLTVHRRRGPLGIGRRPQPGGKKEGNGHEASSEP